MIKFNTTLIKNAVLFLSVLLFSYSSIIAQGSGNIKGVITDKGSGEALIGSNVFLDGTSFGAAADIDGNYIIRSVPAGSYKLVAKYIGYKEQSVQINVVAGRTLAVDIELEYAAVESDEVLVTAQALGQMSAINQQLSSETIKNVISSEKIREIPDVNAAESVGRLPGISVVRSGGEGNKVAIRGMSPQYSVMMVDGVRMQSTDATNRSVDLNMISPSMLSSIEVTKAITADMDADAVGGTVNLKTGIAQEGFNSNIMAKAGYGYLADTYTNYELSGYVSNRFFDEKLGIQLSAFMKEDDRSSDEISAGYEGLGSIIENLDLTNVGITDRVVDRNRFGASLIFDYKFETGNLVFNNFYSTIADNSVNMSNSFTIGTEQAVFNTSQSETNTDVLNNSLRGDFEFFGVKMDFTLANSVSQQDNPVSRTMKIIPYLGGDGFDYTKSLNQIKAGVASGFLEDITIADDFRVERFNGSTRDVVETGRVANLNFEVPYNLGNYVSGKIKLGGKYSYTNRENDENANYVKPDRGQIVHQDFAQLIIDENLWPEIPWEATDLIAGPRASLFADPNYDVGDFLSGNEGISKLFYTGSVDLMNHYIDLATQYNAFTVLPLESFRRDFEYTANQSAFYLMTVMNITEYVTFMPGIRYERYETDYLAYGTHRNGSEAYDFTTEEIKSNRTGENWFPQIHLRIKPVDWMDIRLASTKSIIYPSYTAFSPYYYYDDFVTNVNITKGNPKLKPALAQNLDLYVSVYDNYIGLFTAGLFSKSIDDLQVGYSFSSTDSEDVDNVVNLTGSTNISTTINLDAETTVEGFELDWQTTFWYLPGVLRGLVFSINYTNMTSRTEYPYTVFVRPAGAPVWIKEQIDTARVGRMPLQPNHILNATLGFDYADFSARVSFLYQANVESGSAGQKELRGYTDGLQRWDLSLKQKLPWEGSEFFFNINNITNEPDVILNAFDDRIQEVTYYGTTAEIGLRYRF